MSRVARLIDSLLSIYCIFIFAVSFLFKPPDQHFTLKNKEIDRSKWQTSNSVINFDEFLLSFCSQFQKMIEEHSNDFVNYSLKKTH